MEGCREGKTWGERERWGERDGGERDEEKIRDTGSEGGKNPHFRL